MSHVTNNTSEAFTAKQVHLIKMHNLIECFTSEPKYKKQNFQPKTRHKAPLQVTEPYRIIQMKSLLDYHKKK